MTAYMVQGDTLNDLVVRNINPPLPTGVTAVVRLYDTVTGQSKDYAGVIISTTEVRHPWSADDTPKIGRYRVRAVAVAPDGKETIPTCSPLILEVLDPSS